MLTGLLFAIEEAVDDPSRLVATLPFAGATLIEHQARLLVAAGAAHIVIIGERQSPELLGALHRIGRRGVAIDAVRGAAEAAGALHPLARVVMLADGLVTTDAAVQMVAGEGGDALLVVPLDGAPRHFERIGGASAWAGVARLSPQRLTDLARLPADYDPQSTLVHLAEESGAARVPLPAEAIRDGHGIERDASSLASRAQQVVAAAASRGRGWFDRFLVAPMVRATMPAILAQGVATSVVAGVAAVAGIAGVVALLLGWPRAGLLLALFAVLAAGVGRAMASLRDEAEMQRGLTMAAGALALIALLALGWRCSALRDDGTALSLALGTTIAAMLVERSGAGSSKWWGGPASCLLIVTAMALVGWPLAGLGLGAAYAVAALAMAIEALRSDA